MTRLVKEVAQADDTCGFLLRNLGLVPQLSAPKMRTTGFISWPPLCKLARVTAK